MYVKHSVHKKHTMCRRLPPVTARKLQRPQRDRKQQQVLSQSIELKLIKKT